jgi:hypothetical protein
MCKLKEYACAKNELCVLDNIVLRGTRIVIPRKLRKDVLELAHEGHQGIVKTKQRLRTKVWWPGIDKDCEKLVKSCMDCQIMSQISPPEPIKSTPMPEYAWQYVAADLMGPIPSGEYFLVVVDYYSRYFEVEIVRNTSSKTIVERLEKIFASHSVPETLRTDNGPQFVSQEMEEFLREYGVNHVTSTPYWPQANGEVERQNRTLLKAIKIAHEKRENLTRSISKFLLAYRSTPHTTTGVAPAEMLFKHRYRTKIPDITQSPIDEEIQDRDALRKLKAKQYADYDRNAKASEIEIGDKVLVRTEKKDKLTPNFEKEPYTVLEKNGSEVLIQNENGHQYRRNTSFVKPLESEEYTHEKEIDQPNDEQPQVGKRPKREKMLPVKFRDFVLK